MHIKSIQVAVVMFFSFPAQANGIYSCLQESITTNKKDMIYFADSKIYMLPKSSVVVDGQSKNGILVLSAQKNYFCELPKSQDKDYDFNVNIGGGKQVGFTAKKEAQVVERKGGVRAVYKACITTANISAVADARAKNILQNDGILEAKEILQRNMSAECKEILNSSRRGSEVYKVLEKASPKQ